MFGRWPSSAAFRFWRKPGADSVSPKGEKYCSERFQRPRGSGTACEVRCPFFSVAPPLQRSFGAISTPG